MQKNLNALFIIKKRITYLIDVLDKLYHDYNSPQILCTFLLSLELRSSTK